MKNKNIKKINDNLISNNKKILAYKALFSLVLRDQLELHRIKIACMSSLKTQAVYNVLAVISRFIKR